MDSSQDDQANSSLNRKRPIKNEEFNRILSQEKPMTEHGKRPRHFQSESLTFASRVSSSSHSSVRNVNLPYGSNQQRDLLFSSGGSASKQKNKNLSSADFTHVLSAKPLQLSLSKPGTAGHLRASSQKIPQGYYARSTTSIPKNISIDKEQLYDELLQSKTFNNHLQQDNHSLRTKLFGLHEEMSRLAKKEKNSTTSIEAINPFDADKQKYKRIFNERMTFSAVKVSQQTIPQINQTSIVIALKQQVQEFKQKLQEKEDILEKTLKEVKHTQIKELEIQIQMYSEECLRLRRMIEQSLKLDRDQRFTTTEHHENSIDGKHPLSEAFKVLKSDNMEMAANLKRSEEELFALRVVIETVEKQLRSSKNENNQLRRQLQSKGREIDILNGNDVLGSSGKKNPQFTVEGQLRMEIDKKITEINALQAQVLSKDKRMIDLEKRARDKEADMVEKLSAEIKEKQDIQKMLDREKDTVIRQRQDIERMEARRFTKHEGNGSQQMIFDGDVSGDSSVFSRPTQRKLTLARQATTKLSLTVQHPFVQLNRRRLPKVAHEEVKPLAEDLKYYLKTQKISLAEAENMVLKSDGNQEITLQQVYDVLSDSPFDMEEGALIMARYLIENNEADWVQFDGNATNKVPFVRSAFRHLLDAYTLLSEEQEAEEMAVLVAVMVKQRANLEDLLLRDPVSKKVNGKLCCSMKQLIGLLDQAEIKLSSVAIDLLFTHLFKASNTVAAIPVDQVYKIISVDNIPFIRMKKDINGYQGRENDDKDQSELCESEGEVSNDDNQLQQQQQQPVQSIRGRQNEQQQQQQLEDEEERERGISESRVSNRSRFGTRSRIHNQDEGVRFNDDIDNEADDRIMNSRSEVAENQTSYTQQTQSQFHMDANDPFQEANEEEENADDQDFQI